MVEIVVIKMLVSGTIFCSVESLEVYYALRIRGLREVWGCFLFVRRVGVGEGGG